MTKKLKLFQLYNRLLVLGISVRAEGADSGMEKKKKEKEKGKRARKVEIVVSKVFSSKIQQNGNRKKLIKLHHA